MEFIDLPVEVQEAIMKKIPLKYATIINKKLHEATRVRYCKAFHLSQKQMKNYTTNNAFVRIESQEARTGESYNATIYNNNNNNIMYGTTLIESDSDYVVVTSMAQKYVQNSDYSIIFDEYTIHYDLDLLSIYKSLPECPMKNYKKDKIIAILNDIMEDSITNNREIRKDYKSNLKTDTINYYLWHDIMQHYVYLFTSALVLNMVDHDYFWKPFNEKDEYIFARNEVNGDNKENIKVYKKVLGSINFLYDKLYDYFNV